MNTNSLEPMLQKKWTVIGFFEKVIQAPYSHARPCGVCDRCGQTIRYCVALKSNTGEKITVGQDCAVTLEGGPELVEIRKAMAAYRLERFHEARKAAYEAEKPARDARDALRKALAEKAETEFSVELTQLRAVEASLNTSDWEKKMAGTEIQSILSGSDPTEVKLTDSMTDNEDRRVSGLITGSLNHYLLDKNATLGEVGKRVSFKAYFMGARPFENRFGIKFLVKFLTESGQQIVWWTTGDFPDHKEVGKLFNLKATIKGHEEYLGCKQTNVLRVKYQ